MVRELNTVERRVLGSLLEKSMAQPDYYPMTLNALVAACNQKLNRDPVTSLDEDTVWSALEALRDKGLVTMLLPGGGARTKRFRHEVESHYAWQKRERVVMTELMLRGPQTPGELRTRCSRFMPFDDIEAVMIVLDCLSQADPPWVRAMPREPGRSAIRYAHTLYPEGEAPVAESADAGMRIGQPELFEERDRSADRRSTPVAAEDSTKAEGLRAEVENLQQEVAELHEEIADLRKRLESIESQLL